jgi:hypothetical protein
MTDTPEARRRNLRVVPNPPPDAVEVDAVARPAPRALGPGPLDHVPADSHEPDPTGRRLAPGAPLSPGTAPLELAAHLRVGEALVWWDAKASWDFRPALIVFGVCLLILLGATAIAPGFWRQAWSDMWPPIAALFSPVLLLLVRERLGQRSFMVTDTAIIEVTRAGVVSRLAFAAIQRVRRDVVTGGVLLHGKDTKIRIPPALTTNARLAIASQRRNVVRGDPRPPDDPLGWLP